MASREQLLELCRNVIAPLVAADRGELYVVSAEDDALALHLAGSCSGCPGAPLTIAAVIRPVVQRLSPTVSLVVTVGVRRPPGAVLIEPHAARSEEFAED